MLILCFCQSCTIYKKQTNIKKHENDLAFISLYTHSMLTVFYHEYAVYDKLPLRHRYAFLERVYLSYRDKYIDINFCGKTRKYNVVLLIENYI